MSKQITFSKRVIVLALALFSAALLSVSLLYAHGDEEHQAEPTADSSMAERVDTQLTALESAYEVIAAGFEQLQPIFRKGCYDCHTDQTDYPWYHSLPLIKGLIDEDIKEAREHLDMSNGFPFESHALPADDLAEIKEEIEDGGMPPSLYRLMHWSAKPSEAEQDSLFQWIDNSLKLLAAEGQTPHHSGHADEEDDD